VASAGQVLDFADQIALLPIAYAGGVFPDWKYGPLAEGLACYGREEFFLAHEHWESLWLTLEEPEKSFLQALIQTTAAFHHLQSGNSMGAVSLLRRALRRLEGCPARFGGIDVTSLCTGISAWLRALESGAAPLPATYPAICVAGLPSVSFGSGDTRSR
jgi:hypothetical protein